MVTRNPLPPFALTGWNAKDIARPYPIYQRYRDVDPVHRAADGSYYLFGYDAVATVLTSKDCGRRADTAGKDHRHKLVSDRFHTLATMVDNWLVFLDPPRHTALRAVLNTEFSPGVVSSLRDRIAEITGELLAACIDSAEFDLVDAFSAPLPILVVSELLGVSPEHRTWLRNQAMALQNASSSRAAGVANALETADTAAAELTTFFKTLLARRRTAPGPDLVSLLLSAQLRGEALGADEIVATCVHLLTAGHETTTNVLSKAVLSLRDQPHGLAELRAAPTIAPGAVEELIRFDGPVQAVTRWAYRDINLAGHQIPRGSKLTALLGSANRDPARFEHPDTLDLNRKSSRAVGFGLGIHYCLGATLARAEVEIGLRLLLDALGEFTVEEVEYPCDMVFHGPSMLRIRRH